MADDLTSALDQIRAELRTFGATYAGESRLLAAVDEVLELAADWERRGDEADDRAEAASERADSASLMLSGRGQALHDCSFALREAITTALTGEKADHA